MLLLIIIVYLWNNLLYFTYQYFGFFICFVFCDFKYFELSLRLIFFFFNRHYNPLLGFGLLNYRWAFSAGRFLQSAVASSTSNPQLGGRLLLILCYFMLCWNVDLHRKYGENFVGHRVIFLSPNCVLWHFEWLRGAVCNCNLNFSFIMTVSLLTQSSIR